MSGRRERLARQTRFCGTIQQLQAIVAQVSYHGDWQRTETSYWRFDQDNGAILNWWPQTGTLGFQGPPAAARQLEQSLTAYVENMATLRLPPRQGDK